ncbi:hypothetical protein [Caballeronia sp. LZ001]|uniref:hypothetical protein n=1 Tax=Caballeronia sp. LZ001 TaxID=3038553 RepID=UPI00285A0895|nr:hypothetical protein [Caballeronia sp. LZ001]MDR5775594.1 hypothetical protein [Caballeronia sp. LZ002]MDR5802311.1 hypothetical protein [Caballeronia sp. LZ001]MDR5851032.1 hypothetical protein [Caballeronia sp. LZ003]
MDAENAAHAVFAGKATALPKERSGAAEAMRAVCVVHRSAIKAWTQAINQLRSLLVSAPQDIRERLLNTKKAERVASCKRLRSLGDTVMLQALTSLLIASEQPPAVSSLRHRKSAGLRLIPYPSSAIKSHRMVEPICLVH